MLFPPRNRFELIRELEDNEAIAGIFAANGPKEELLSGDVCDELYADKVTVVVLWRKDDWDHESAEGE